MNEQEKALEVKKELLGENEKPGRLLPYQLESVNAICDHFKEHQKSLLADEVGLGKTEVAKGVLARLTHEHWVNPNQQSTSKPYRVAYICPNQNISEQNYRKFDMYSNHEILFSGLKGSTEENSFKERLQKILASYYQNVEKNYKGQSFVEQSVYTRIWDWLLALCEPNVVIDKVLGAYAVFLYYDESSDIEKRLSSEYSSNDNFNRSSTIKECARNLLIAGRNLLNEYVSKDYICAGIYNEILKQLNAPKGTTKDFANIICSINKAVAKFLCMRHSSLRYRISMLHLCELETCCYSKGSAVQLFSLTPSTSFNESSTGTYQERALVCATYDVLVGVENPLFEKDPKKSKANNYSQEYSSFCELLNMYIGKEEVQDLLKELQDLFIKNKGEFEREYEENGPENAYKKIRNMLIGYNLGHMNFDLVIMDEFQNYEQLVIVNGDKSEANEIAEQIFNNSKTKVLMLSATPFAVADYVPELLYDEPDPNDNFGQEEDDCDKLDNRKMILGDEAPFNQFFDLVHFMLDLDDKKLDRWKAAWTVAISKSENKELCNLLMDQAGIFRTERIAAAKVSPVKRECYETESEFKYVLLANKLASDENWNGWRMNYAKSTPYALSFSSSYALKNNKRNSFEETYKSKNVNSYSDLFISKKALTNHEDIPVNNSQYKTLQKLILENELYKLLWIPPCNPTNSLKGPFEGKRGLSKTLIFAHYRMTPMALTYLLSHAVDCKIFSSKQNLPESIQKEELKKKLANFFEKIDDELKNVFCDYFVSLFESTYGQKVVRLSFPEDDYEGAVEKYCKAGCLNDVLTEYVELLKNEYCIYHIKSDKKEKMPDYIRIKKVVNYLKDCLNDNSDPYLILLKEKDELEKCRMTVSTPFAVGLYSEKPSDAVKRLKKIKAAFNSPFLPFVFSTTSIGTEGIDLHWYARNVVHWSLPQRPVDIEQREGRVLRYKCHAFRLNAALIGNKDKLEQAINSDWIESGMYESQLNFFCDEEYNNENQEGCFHVWSKFFFDKASREELGYDEAMKLIQTYRSLIGRDMKAYDEKAEPLCLAPFVKKVIDSKSPLE